MENNPLWAELGKHWKLVALRGVAALVFGVLTLLSPALALTVLVLFWGAYALVDGAFALIAAFNMRSDGQFNWPLALVGVIGVAAGLVAFFWPQLTAIGLLLIIAGWALAMGIFQIVAAIRLRKSIQNEWWMILSGAISVLFGVLMIANPGAGALAVFLLLTILIVHTFWSKTGVEAKLAMFFALEHIAVIGGLIATAIASAQRQRLRQDVSVAATYQKA